MTKSYRSPVTATGLCVAGLCALGAAVGLAETLASPGKGGVAGQILGVFVALLVAGIGLAAIMTGVSTRLVVSGEGLTWRYNLRSRHIAWPDIQSVSVGFAGGWACLQIDMVHGMPTLIRSVTGTNRCVESIAADIRASRETLTDPAPGICETGPAPAH